MCMVLLVTHRCQVAQVVLSLVSSTRSALGLGTEKKKPFADLDGDICSISPEAISAIFQTSWTSHFEAETSYFCLVVQITNTSKETLATASWQAALHLRDCEDTEASLHNNKNEILSVFKQLPSQLLPGQTCRLHMVLPDLGQLPASFSVSLVYTCEAWPPAQPETATKNSRPSHAMKIVLLEDVVTALEFARLVPSDPNHDLDHTLTAQAHGLNGGNVFLPSLQPGKQVLASRCSNTLFPKPKKNLLSACLHKGTMAETSQLC
eukprot:m.187412 g.187412  ORF g.187412 m.187412 type:complete len:264 (+) comp16712_c1_seq14:1500-2291(+)